MLPTLFKPQKLATWLVCIAGFSCGASDALGPPPGRLGETLPEGPHPATGVRSSPEAGRFAALRERLLDELLREEPSLGRSVGLHEYDGKLADYSASGIGARIARLKKACEELAAIEASALADDDALD